MEIKDRQILTIEQGYLVKHPPRKKVSGRAPSRSSWRYLTFVSAVGWVVAVPLVAGAFIGKWIDSRWDIAPKAILIGLIVGLTISVLNLVRLIQKMLKGS